MTDPGSDDPAPDTETIFAPPASPRSSVTHGAIELPIPPIDATPPEVPIDPAPWGLKGAVIVTSLSLLSQLAMAVVLGGLAYVVLTLYDPDLVNHPGDLQSLMVLVTVAPLALLSSVVTVGLVYASITAICRRPFLASLGLNRPSGSSLALYLALGYGLALGYVALSFLYPMPLHEDTEGPLSRLAQSGPLGHAVWMALALVMAPIVEEILFRGYAYLGARRVLGPGRAGAAVTVLFVLLHVTETGGYWPALAGITTLATLLIVVMERTGNLAYCIACHLGYNAALVSLSLVDIGG